MVLEKNMIRKIFLACIFLFYISGCSTYNNNKEEVYIPVYEAIKINVFDFKMTVDEEKYYFSNDLGFEADFLLDYLRSWGNKKFKVNGEKNSLLLNIDEFSLNKKDIKKAKGLKKIFSADQTKYYLKLKITLRFLDNDKVLKMLKLNGNINFIVKENFSISQKRKFLQSSYLELLKKVDETLNKELSKEAFLNFQSI